jgi:hypothetical protein
LALIMSNSATSAIITPSTTTTCSDNPGSLAGRNNIWATPSDEIALTFPRLLHQS